ncbi:hypothetical protein LTR84_001138 [Exophiala bonariae]|uniref:Nucleoporin NUP53 n=1 Tax=Exophiala bonariae TaxID=1690606 RepID=A0AAV9NV57_9EURO|nr:hypothetical protein LTR84_001138 [Exophiala bonariae]
MDSTNLHSEDDDSDSSSSARSARQPEESGPFGRNRSTRATGSRASRTRTGTTPVRQKESSAVSDFGKLFAKEQEREAERTKSTLNTPSADTIEPELVPTECLLYGYAGKTSEWKVLSKFEKIVSPGVICEDYSREDPNLFLSSNSPLAFSRSSIVVRNNLSREAIKKSRVYMGGQHWIKVTFDSYQAAERAIHYSPVEIDGYLVHCEMWSGRGPVADAAMPVGPEGQDSASLIRPDTSRKARTLSASRSANMHAGSQSALAGFERAYQTLPKSQTLPDLQFRQPGSFDDLSTTSTTASSATATAFSPPPQSPTGSSNLRSRSVPSLPARKVEDLTQSEYMTHIKVKKAVLRPISEALPPQPSFGERVLRSIPIVSWFVGANKGTAGNAGIIGEGPLLKEDGSWDPANGWYWSFWHNVDYFLKTDFCGLKDG